MAIALRGSASASAINGGNVAVSLSSISGLAEDDFVIFAYGTGTFADESMSVSEADWDDEGGNIYSDDLRDTNLGVFSKRMGATPDTTVTGVGTGNSAHGTAGIAMAFSGVDTTTALDVAIQIATGGNTFIPNPPSVSGLSSGAATVIIGAAAHTRAGWNETMPTGYDTNHVHIHANDTTDITLDMGYNLSPGDPEDPGTITNDDSDSGDFSWAAVTIALREAGGAASIIPLIMHHRRQQS